MTRLLALLVPIAFILSIDLYFFQAVRMLLKDQSASTRIVGQLIYWGTSAILIAALVFSSQRGSLPNYQRYLVFSVFLVFFFPKIVGALFMLIEDGYRFTSAAFHALNSDSGFTMPGRRKFVSTLSVATASVPFLSLIYGMVRTGFNIQLRRKEVLFDDLPDAFDGLTIAQISDLHSGSFVDNVFFERAVNEINALKPDLVFFTGDLVNNEAVEAERFVSTFSKLNAKMGVYSILGNHDYGDYGPWPSEQAKQENLQRLKNIHHDSNWNLLLNENRVVSKDNQQLAIVGVENWGTARHFPKKGDLDVAVKGAEHVDFKILLSHDPSHWDAKVRDHQQKFQLTLSGHTHGAQFGIEIPGIKWSPAKYIYKQWAGLYESNDGQKIYVNRGLGYIGYMGRIGIPPEITYLTLRKRENA